MQDPRAVNVPSVGKEEALEFFLAKWNLFDEHFAASTFHLSSVDSYDDINYLISHPESTKAKVTTVSLSPYECT
jgi:hypothetical protein